VRRAHCSLQARGSEGQDAAKRGQKMPIEPFDQSGIVRGADGIKRYQGLATSLVKMLRVSVDKAPQSEAIVGVCRGRVTYRQLWDHCARIAGGLKEAGIAPG